jgi:outer membrane receptor for ferrienterochelin and colicins
VAREQQCGEKVRAGHVMMLELLKWILASITERRAVTSEICRAFPDRQALATSLHFRRIVTPCKVGFTVPEIASVKSATKPVVLLLVMGGLSLPALHAAAADKPVTNFSEFRQLMDMEVTTATLRPQKASDSPATTTVITQREIAGFGYRTLAEALRSITGIYIRNDRNYLDLGVRGFSIPGDFSTRVLLLVDGYRVNDPAYHQPLFDYLLPIPLEAVSQIEVVMGPGSTLYGSDALLATINIITKDGEDVQTASAKAEGGNNNSVRSVLTYGKKFGSDVDLIASGLIFRSEGDSVVRSPGLQPISNADREDATLGFAKLRYGNWTASVSGSARSKEIPTASYTTIPEKGSSTTDDYLFSDIRYYRSLDSTKSFTFRTSLNNYTYDGHYLIDNGAPLGVLDLRDQMQTTWSRSELQFFWDIADWSRLTAGGSYERDFRVRQKLFDATGVMLDINTPTWTYGLFVQDQIALGSKTDLTLGVRFDEYRDSGNTGNYRAALVDRHLPNTTLKLLYGTASRTPTPYELFYTDNVTLAANPSLKIEEITTYEAVIVHAFPYAITASLSAFNYLFHNLIAQRDIGGGLVSYENVGKSKARGLELDISKRWLGSGMVHLGGVLQKAKDENGDHRVDSPYYIVYAGIVTPLWNRNNTLGVDVQFLGERETLQGGSTGTSHLTTLTFRSRDVFGLRRLDLTATVYNLFNERGFVPGGNEHRQDLIPSPNRLVLAGLQYSF